MVEAIAESLRDIREKLFSRGQAVPTGEGWKELVKDYLSIEHCDYPGAGPPYHAHMIQGAVAFRIPSGKSKRIGNAGRPAPGVRGLGNRDGLRDDPLTISDQTEAPGQMLHATILRI